MRSLLSKFSGQSDFSDINGRCKLGRGSTGSPSSKKPDRTHYTVHASELLVHSQNIIHKLSHWAGYGIYFPRKSVVASDHISDQIGTVCFCNFQIRRTMLAMKRKVVCFSVHVLI